VADPEGTRAGGGRVRLVGVTSHHDWTGEMTAFASRRVDALASLELCGYVLKKDSPSCGLERVRVYTGTEDTPAEAGRAPVKGGRMPPMRTGRGLYAEALIGHMPDLPVEEEGRLSDPALRDNFV